MPSTTTTLDDKGWISHQPCIRMWDHCLKKIDPKGRYSPAMLKALRCATYGCFNEMMLLNIRSLLRFLWVCHKKLSQLELCLREFFIFFCICLNFFYAMFSHFYILRYPLFFLRGTVRRQPTISGYQNITFDSIILTLCSTNITCYCIFVTFNGSLIFSHIW